MRYFWTFLWSFLLVEMLTYVVSSMNGSVFDFKIGAIMSVIVSLSVIAISTIVPNEPSEHQ